ncbi:jg4741, partial [Pararge aegeria aegeria]
VMGVCCCKESVPDELVYLPAPARLASPVVEEPTLRISQVVDPHLIERLIMEMLTVAATRVDTDQIPHGFSKYAALAFSRNITGRKVKSSVMESVDVA